MVKQSYKNDIVINLKVEVGESERGWNMRAVMRILNNSCGIVSKAGRYVEHMLLVIIC